MSICAAAANAVSRPWFFAQMSHLLNAHIVVTIGLNVYFPLLPAPVLLQGQAMRLQYLDAGAPASLEPHN
jgi:hypothetical protein